MINSVKEYISILKVLVTKTSDYILLQTGKKSDIVSSSKPLSEIFPGYLQKKILKIFLIRTIIVCYVSSPIKEQVLLFVPLNP